MSKIIFCHDMLKMVWFSSSIDQNVPILGTAVPHTVNFCDISNVLFILMYSCQLTIFVLYVKYGFVLLQYICHFWLFIFIDHVHVDAAQNCISYGSIDVFGHLVLMSAAGLFVVWCFIFLFLPVNTALVSFCLLVKRDLLINLTQRLELHRAQKKTPTFY